jgi:hypothetical protein
MTQDPTGDPKVVESLYSSEGSKCYRRLMMVRAVQGVSRPVDLATW